MLILILLLIFGVLMVYLAQVGTTYFATFPLFYVIMGSLLTGLLLSYTAYVINSIFVALKMRGKNKEIKQGESDIVDLTKRIHQLELENEKLKNNSAIVETPDKNAL
ncbi:MAG: hypothetical protein AAB838_00165 [Patescibacteria group bacterium]